MPIELRNHLFNRGTALVLNGEQGLKDADIASLLDFSIEEKRALRVVVLSNTSVTGRCLQYLACLPNLREIYLNGTEITDEAPMGLIGGGIRVLNLDDTRIGDSAVAKLRMASGLRILCLRHTRITDHSAHMLGSFPQLREYHVSGTRVSNYARRRLDNSLELEDASAASAFRSGFHQLSILLQKAVRFMPTPAL